MAFLGRSQKINKMTHQIGQPEDDYVHYTLYVCDL